ncbi:hypothetical protein [Romboutsia timonensis]|uniref:hypothetical protein n=1 Tax=Romboutsia timonensis TaxID=1776391 RepID=UPI0008D9BAFF|nr:hypothetical protein [Romboutsia timonensis]
MKKVWNKPNISNLSLEDTMAKGEIMSNFTRGDKRWFAWRCCCGVTSDFIYPTATDADIALSQHESTCQHPCLIS